MFQLPFTQSSRFHFLCPHCFRRKSSFCWTPSTGLGSSLIYLFSNHASILCPLPDHLCLSRGEQVLGSHRRNPLRFGLIPYFIKSSSRIKFLSFYMKTVSRSPVCLSWTKSSLRSHLTLLSFPSTSSLNGLKLHCLPDFTCSGELHCRKWMLLMKPCKYSFLFYILLEACLLFILNASLSYTKRHASSYCCSGVCMERICIKFVFYMWV